MPLYTDEQVAAARSVDLLAYLQAYEPSVLKREGSAYRHREHESLVFYNGYCYWNREARKMNALDYLMDMRGYRFADAMRVLMGEPGAITAPTFTRPPPEAEKPRPLLCLPMPNTNNHRAIAYLQGRGISKEVVAACISRRILYESRGHHNCVFVGKNPDGKARFACERGTSDDWKKDLTGSDKRFSFAVPARNPANTTLNVFEAPVDLLSFASLRGRLWDLQHHLSLGGTSPRALDQYLKDHPGIRCVNLCLDNDRAGRKATARLTKQLGEKGIIVTNTPPSSGKDYNAHLQNVRQQQKEARRPVKEAALSI